MGMAAVARRPALKGSPTPRLAPPTPLKSDVKGFKATARKIGLKLFRWQETAAHYLEAINARGRHLYREVAVVVARQNGKTTLLVPLIVKRLVAGRRIMHTAQNRELPREVFAQVAEIIERYYPELLLQRNGRVVRPRFANGQEEIRLNNGGRYRIVAPTRGGARGPTNDDVIVDELRELEGFEFIAAAKPTMTASPDPQIIYLSNAGTVDSVVLNALRERAGKDPRLAYLEWSAAPDRAADDQAGWAEANPSIGAIPTMLEYLEDEYLSNKLGNTLPLFEVEHLCRWQNAIRETLVDAYAWNRGEDEELEAAIRPAMGISLDPDGKRASAAVAWQRSDGSLGLRLLFNVTGDPIDTDQLGPDLVAAARAQGVRLVGFDPLTDAVLAKHFRRTEPIAGQKWANASARFVAALESEKVKWQDCAAVGDDLTWTARKPHDETGSFQAVRAQDDRPITAALAAIRAVWLASTPRAPSQPTESREAPAAMGW
jgi:hypothetical protein